MSLDTLERLIWWVFWLGLGLVLLFDLILALYHRMTLSRRLRHFGMDVPTFAYAAGLVPTHLWMNYAQVGPMAAALILVGIGAGILVWEYIDGAPMHPFLAFAIGLLGGAFAFPL